MPASDASQVADAVKAMKDVFRPGRNTTFLFVMASTYFMGTQNSKVLGTVLRVLVSLGANVSS